MNTSTVIVRALLVAALVCVASAAHPNFHMKFHQDSLVNGQSLPLPHGVTFPTKIQLVDSAGAADLTSSGLIITASVAAPASLTGNVAVVKNGVADFSHLAFATCGGMPSAITFTADTRSTLAVAGKSLVSGQISVQPVRNAEVLFDSTSFLKAGAAATAVSGVSMGAIKINLLDSCGNKDASNTGFTVVASTNNGTLLGETAATFTNGVAIFTGLSFADAPTNARLTFTVLTNGAGAAEGKKLVTGVVAVHAQALPSVGIRFKKSHSAFVTVGSGAAVALNAHFTPSAVVEVVDSADRVDATGALTVTITSSDASVGMVGTSAVAVNGVADFSSFKFTGCPAAPVRLTFTAGSEGNTAAAGKAIVSGDVVVKGVANQRMALSATMVSGITKGAVMQAVRIEILDSCNNVQADNSQTVVTVTSVGVPISGTVTKVATNGIVTFDDLAFLSAGDASLTFTAGSQTGGAVDGATLATRTIRVLAAKVANFGVRFATPPMRTVVAHAPMKTVAVQFVDSNGEADTSNSATTVTASVSSAALGDCAASKAEDGVVRLDSLKLVSCPNAGGATSPATATLTFTVGSEGSTAATGQSLTQTVTVVGIPNSAMRFKPTGSAFTAPFQPLVAGEGVPLAPVIVEMMDSCEIMDTTDSETQLTATASSGTLTGATATFRNGVARFDNLRFATMPDGNSATLTFTASGNVPASGLRLVTGVVSVERVASTRAPPSTRHSASSRPFLALSSSQFSAVAFCVALVVCCALFYGCAKRGAVKYVAVGRQGYDVV